MLEMVEEDLGKVEIQKQKAEEDLKVLLLVEDVTEIILNIKQLNLQLTGEADSKRGLSRRFLLHRLSCFLRRLLSLSVIPGCNRFHLR